MKQNEHIVDRLLRILLGEALSIVGYFWVGGLYEYILLGLAAIMFCTGFSGFCLLYTPFKINTKERFRLTLTKPILIAAITALIITPLIGVYTSNFFTKKIFLEDFNRMNSLYKLTLFNTGQENRSESIANYEKWSKEYEGFSSKYLSYKPFVLKTDRNVNADLADVSKIISDSKEQIYTGDLKALHYKLEDVRLTFQNLLKRNGFSMLGVALVDFHDSMEILIADSDKKDLAAVIRDYSDTDQKLKAAEELLNNEEMKTIRTNLDKLLGLAQSGKSDELSKQAAELKNSFIKVYLKNN